VEIKIEQDQHIEHGTNIDQLKT